MFCPFGGINYGAGQGTSSFHGYMWSNWDGDIGGSRQPAIYIEHDVTVTPPNGGPEPILIDVQKTVHTAFAREYTWTIDKNVTPAAWNIFAGDSAESSYTVAVRKTGFTSTYVATGTITVTNNSAIPVLLTSVSDVISTGQVVDVTPMIGPNGYVLDAGASVVFEYETTLADDSPRTNTATAIVKVLGRPDTTAMDTEPVNFSQAPNVEVNKTINVDDTFAGALGSASTDTTFTYSRTFRCADEGVKNNTATIVETGQSDSAAVTVNCYDIEVSKDAHTSFTRTYHWGIDKSVVPEKWDFFQGDSGTSAYTVALTKDAGTDSSVVVTGTITIHNPAPMTAIITDVSDYISPAIGAALVNPPSFPMPLGSGETTSIAYTASLPDTTPRTNTATAVLRNHDYDWLQNATLAGTTNFTGSSPVVFGEATTKINDSVHVTDSVEGPLGEFSNSALFGYSKTFDCEDAGEHPNRATIVETQQSDDATVTVKCWNLGITKDGAGTFKRSFNWTINKSVTPSVWNFLTGGSGVSTYTVTLTKSAPVDSDYAASGKIYITNPAPVPATINSVTDVIQVVPVTATILNAPVFPYTLQANSTLTLDYVAPLVNATTQTNKATYIQQHYHFSSAGAATPSVTSSDSALAQIVFGGPTTVVNDTIHVNDTWKLSLGAFSTSSVVRYPRTFTCADVGDWPNTATITETGQSSSANVHVTCSSEVLTPGLAILKTASPDCIVSGTVVTYTYVVTNSGQTVLTNVLVTDDKIGDIGTIQVLNPGQSVSLTKTSPIQNDTINVGTATAGTLVATDTASVDVVHPALEVEKTSDAPDAGVEEDTKVTYSYTVKNVGDVPLFNVDVVDDKLGVVASDLTLAVNETKTLPSKEATLTETTTNIVTATGDDSCNHQASDTDQLTVEVFLPFTPPDVELEKSAGGATFSPGDLVTYTLTYTNIGEGPAENFTIVDDYDQRYVTVEDAAGGVDDGDKITWTIAGPLAPQGNGDDHLHDEDQLGHPQRHGHRQHRSRGGQRRRERGQQRGRGPGHGNRRGGVPALHRWRTRAARTHRAVRRTLRPRIEETRTNRRIASFAGGGIAAARRHRRAAVCVWSRRRVPRYLGGTFSPQSIC